MLRPFVPMLLLVLAAPAVADDKDWTGKTVTLTAEVKLGQKQTGGLLRNGAVLVKSKVYVVKSDDGEFVELVGESGLIYKSEAEVVAVREMPKRGAPAPKVDAKNLWARGAKVLPKKRTWLVQFGDRDADGSQFLFPLSTNLPLEVRSDNGDGWVRIHDRVREGWVHKDDLVTKDEAPAHWDRELKADPENTHALYMRGIGWREKGELDKALNDFNECIRLEPDFTSAYLSRGNVLSDRRQFAKAIADYTEVIRRSPQSSLAYCNRGHAYNDTKEYDKALKDLDESIRLNPRYVPAHLTRGKAWYGKGEHDKAIANYTEALRLDPRYISPYLHRGLAWAAKGEHDKAIADYSAAVRLDPKSIYAHQQLAAGWAAKKEYKNALRGFETLAELNPRHAYAFHQIAWLCATCPDPAVRDGKKAIEAAKKAMSLDKLNDYGDTLAAAYAEAGEFDQAVSVLLKTLENKTIGADGRKVLESRLKLYRDKKPFRDG
ncbi:TPR repeat-containing protein YrrB [Gemmata obscuriglobus]|nr:tetratricopeptide repeat protein [Gemmata obscuriglobus]QEG31033.1 TPR repeat-containing protein YrrB [Gemmata obscuriglobus]VTS10370.1 peptidase c14 caspase catalytic subunit p20 : Tetratricopeptide repeat protein OS=Singulisphaera acidiphila (strain ATCC BAA-1392 / DSM 18658 / VKM B-2454 / MOB10) GN=Sinac_0326 PE=4 SV=1: TPR_2: TPR_11: TPR_11 [Gemmata obscuriglobus UQM 2246]